MEKLRYCVFGFVISVFLAGNLFAADAENGQKIFNQKCKSCHRTNESSLVGPGLAGVTKRRSLEWLDRWLADPAGMIESKDPIAIELLGKYKKKMRNYKEMEVPENRQDVIEYLKTLE